MIMLLMTAFTAKVQVRDLKISVSPKYTPSFISYHRLVLQELIEGERESEKKVPMA